MKLFVLRHAHAEDGYPDSNRPLSEHGAKQLAALCDNLNPDMFSNVAQVWLSPYIRAVQTANIFCKNEGINAPLLEDKNLVPHGDSDSLARTIAGVCQFGSDLILVTHNPLAENLADALLGGKTGLLHFNKCSLARFSLEGLPNSEKPYGIWSLSMLVNPSHFQG